MSGHLANKHPAVSAMKPEPPAWLGPVLVPLIAVVALLLPILELQKQLSGGNALGVSIAVLLAAAGWAIKVWRDRVPPVLTGASPSWRYSRWVRYASLGVFALALSGTGYLSWVTARPVNDAPQASIEIPFALTNMISSIPIWLQTEGEIQVLSASSPGHDQILTGARVRVSMPNTFTINRQFQVDSNSTGRGIIAIPPRFDLKQFMGRGLQLRVMLHVQPMSRTLTDDRILDDALLKDGFTLAVRL